MGSWAYEICPGRWVRQWHSGARADSNAESSDLPVDSVRTLGTLHSEFSWPSDWAYYLNASRELARHDAVYEADSDSSGSVLLGVLRPESRVDPDSTSTPTPTSSAHSSVLELPPEVLYQFHSQLYANGTRCEPSGRQFETLVRVCRCPPRHSSCVFLSPQFMKTFLCNSIRYVQCVFFVFANKYGEINHQVYVQYLSISHVCVQYSVQYSRFHYE